MMLALCAGVALAQIDAHTGEPVARIAEPLLIVAPKYPPNAPTRRKEVEVKVIGTVTEKGDFAATSYQAGDGEEAFVQAVRDVLPKWRFEPTIDKARCRPQAYEAQVSVWFEMTEKGPAISASMPQPRKPAAGAAKAKPDKPAWKAVKWRPRIDYPAEAYRRGIEGKALVLFKVESASGKLLEVNLLAYSPNEVFNDEALAKAREFEFHPLDPAWGENACLLWEFSYCFPDAERVALPDSTCKRKRAREQAQAAKMKQGDSLIWQR